MKLCKRKKLKKWFFVLFFLLMFAIFGTDFMVKKKTQKAIYTSVSEIPYKKVGLLLGTSKTLANGNSNLYYKYRIDAAVKLFKSGKISYILVSGDNGREGYDETTAMQTDLVNRGIPKNRIVMDYAGFRTLDSVIRANKVFGLTEFTVISQQFHNERAIFIANYKGLKAIGFNAKDVRAKTGIKVIIREKLARVKMVLDLLFYKKPKFLGKPIPIG